MARGLKKEPIYRWGTDKMIPRHVYNKPFTLRLPERNEWKVGGLIRYTDGCKTNNGTGIGVCGYVTRQKLGFSIGK
jgi:hypothetical protein